MTGNDEIPEGLQPADVDAAHRASGRRTAQRACHLVQENDRLIRRPEPGERSRWPTIRIEGSVVCQVLPVDGWKGT